MLTKNLIYVLLLTLIISGFFAFFNKSAFASSTDGIIDSTYKYAWSENTGWINFGTSNGSVHITDSGLSGYALSETVGWIYLGAVTNDGQGNLSGYGWGENVGYIKFNPANGGVIINSSGEFTGSALGENIGWIIFNGNYKVRTDWLPRSARPACNNSLDDNGNGAIDYPNDLGCSSLTDTDENTPNAGGVGLVSGSGGETVVSSGTPTTPTSEPSPVSKPEPSAEKPTSEIIPPKETEKPLIEKIAEFLKPKPFVSEFPKEIKPLEIIIPKDIKPMPTIEQIREILPDLFVASKSPDSVLKKIEKENYYQIAKTQFVVNESFKKSLSAFKYFGEELKEISSNIKLFAVAVVREPAFLVKDLGYAMGEGSLMSAKGVFNLSKNIGKLAVLRISGVGGKIIGLGKSPWPDIAAEPKPSVISPDIAVKEENIILKSRFGGIELSQKEGGIVSLTGLNVKSFIKPEKNETVKSVKTEIYLQKMALKDFDKLNNREKHSSLINKAMAKEFVEFEENKAKFGEYYYNKNNNGIWETIMVSPAFAGEYELKTTIEYQNNENKEILNLMVVKIKGWVYYSHPKGQIRLSKAKAELYYFNDQKKLFELWPAGVYGQKNPQVTGDSGEYAFLLPKGRYYLKVSKDGYFPFESREFELEEPNILNQTIALGELVF